MAQQPIDHLQGTLDLLILRTLAAGGPMHGYGVSRWIRARTDSAIAITDAALYPALRRLEQRGWVAARWGVTESGRRARYYELRPLGREQLQREMSVWREYVAAVVKVLDPAMAEG